MTMTADENKSISGQQSAGTEVHAPPANWLRWRFWLSIAYVAVWALSAINPKHPADWLLENALTIIFAVVFLATWRRFCFSPLTHVLLFLFLTLHAIGSHYTYAEVPYDQWSLALFGFSINEVFGFERNHFDRLVHFSYGLLLAYPAREALVRWAGLTGFWSYFIPLDLTMSTSMLYELIEWGAAELFGGELGQAYLGTQGDVWDAHKDMALASLGALIAILIAYALRNKIKPAPAPAAQS
jgi:putative membrane protein